MYDSERSTLVQSKLSAEESARYFKGIVELHALKLCATDLELKCIEAEAFPFAEWDKRFTELLKVERDIAELTRNLIDFELKAKEEADSETKIFSEKSEELHRNK